MSSAASLNLGWSQNGVLVSVLKHFLYFYFSEMKSVCNQLCKELMSDILHITSKSEEEDYTELQKYLLNDRGWLLIQVIFKKGVKVGITENPQYSKLINWLYGV